MHPVPLQTAAAYGAGIGLGTLMLVRVGILRVPRFISKRTNAALEAIANSETAQHTPIEAFISGGPPLV